MNVESMKRDVNKKLHELSGLLRTGHEAKAKKLANEITTKIKNLLP